jgi:F-type H+-transporting ATPase subunit a
MTFSPLEQFTTIKLFSFYFFGYDFSFLNVIIPLVIILFFFKSFVNFFIKDFKLVPDFWQFFLELLFKFILDIITQQVGKHALVYFPFIFNLFVFVLFCNFISLTPFGIALTSHIIIIFFLSFSL